MLLHYDMPHAHTWQFFSPFSVWYHHQSKSINILTEKCLLSFVSLSMLNQQVMPVTYLLSWILHNRSRVQRGLLCVKQWLPPKLLREWTWIWTSVCGPHVEMSLGMFNLFHSKTNCESAKKRIQKGACLNLWCWHPLRFCITPASSLQLILPITQTIRIDWAYLDA